MVAGPKHRLHVAASCVFQASRLDIRRRSMPFSGQRDRDDEIDAGAPDRKKGGRARWRTR
eukprot:15470689-Alexandrium_andersonii.AAC.1